MSVSTCNKRHPITISLTAVSTKALYIYLSCPCSNAEKILGFLNSGVLSRELIPQHINFSHLTAEGYTEMYGVIKAVKEDSFAQLGLDACQLEDELNKVRRDEHTDRIRFVRVIKCMFSHPDVDYV